MIKIRFEKWENAVVMQVLKQDKYSFSFTNKADMILKSVGRPSLYLNAVYLRGIVEEKDLDVCVLQFKNNFERNVYYDEVIKLFEDYKNRDKEKESTETNVFILE